MDNTDACYYAYKNKSKKKDPSMDEKYLGVAFTGFLMKGDVIQAKKACKDANKLVIQRELEQRRKAGADVPTTDEIKNIINNICTDDSIKYEIEKTIKLMKKIRKSMRKFLNQ